MTAVSFEQQSYVACSLKLKSASTAFGTPQTQNGVDRILEAYCQCISPIFDRQCLKNQILSRIAWATTSSVISPVIKLPCIAAKIDSTFFTPPAMPIISR